MTKESRIPKPKYSARARFSGLGLHSSSVIRLLSFHRHVAVGLATMATVSICLAANPSSNQSGGAFHHPGILVNRAQLDFIKAKVATNAEPWKSAFEAAKTSEWGSLTYTPHPWKTCECGPYSRPD